jgi:hypothetical protein
MRTLTIYTFDELSDEAKAKAIEAVREDLKEKGHDQFAFQWAVDDCALFEPPHAEMAELLGEDYCERNLTPDGKYGQFVFKNNRKGIRWDDYWEEAGIESALEITNDSMFKTWLGIPEKLQSQITYLIFTFRAEYRTDLELEHNLLSDNPMIPALEGIFQSAKAKFKDHMSIINKRIAQGMKDYYCDDEMEVKIEEVNWEFNEDGSIFR